jgi:hypothetical protein
VNLARREPRRPEITPPEQTFGLPSSPIRDRESNEDFVESALAAGRPVTAVAANSHAGATGDPEPVGRRRRPLLRL